MSQPLVSWPGALSWRPPAGLCVLYSLPVGWPPQGLSLGTGRQCMTGLRTPRTRPADQGDRRLAGRPPRPSAVRLRSPVALAVSLRSPHRPFSSAHALSALHLLSPPRSVPPPAQCACSSSPRRSAHASLRLRSPRPRLCLLQVLRYRAPRRSSAAGLGARRQSSARGSLLRGSASVLSCGARRYGRPCSRCG